MALNAPTSLSALRMTTLTNEKEEKRSQERRRNTLVLLLQHLQNNGYVDSASCLEQESAVILNKYDIADNIQLENIFQEVEDYHFGRLGRRPKFTRRVGAIVEAPAENGPTTTHGRESNRAVKSAGRSTDRSVDKQRSNSAREPSKARDGGSDASTSTKVDQRRSKGGGHNPSSTRNGGNPPQTQLSEGLQITVAPVSFKSKDASAGAPVEDERRLPKPLPDFDSIELRELAESIQRDIYLDSPNVTWDSIAGLEEAKRLLKEAVVMPVRYPQFFTGLLAPWKGVLLYGPPGTGKTMLAKAVATECQTTFFNISASSVISKWRGDSEKLIRVLFELARYYAPSTIFLDEIDALMSARGGGGGEHEASRRMKTELLIQMDGLVQGEEMVFLLAATNLPWELDLAMLRRLEKRILVPLPNKEARLIIISKLLESHASEPNVSYQDLALHTEGYSGADVMLVCKESAMRPLRRLMSQLEYGSLPPAVTGRNKEAVIGPIMVEDVEAAKNATKPSAVLHLDRYEKWSSMYGSTL